MPNKNYAKGSAFERKVKESFRQLKWVVAKVGGSKGAFDLMCMKAGWPSGLLVQCKCGGARVSVADAQALLADANRAGAIAVTVEHGPRINGSISKIYNVLKAKASEKSGFEKKSVSLADFI